MKKILLHSIFVFLVTAVSAQNVGIGTNTPIEKLHVVGDVYLPSPGSYWIGSNSDKGNRLRMHQGGSGAYIDYNQNLTFRSGSTDLSAISATNRVYFANNGDVGIGTTSPTSKLHVKGTLRADNASDAAEYMIYNGDNLEIYSPENASGYVRLGAAFNLPGLYSSTDLNLFCRDVNHDMLFRVGGSEIMRIEGSTSRVGIGKNAPSEKLHVLGNQQIEGTGTPYLSIHRPGAVIWHAGVKDTDFFITKDGLPGASGTDVGLYLSTKGHNGASSGAIYAGINTSTPEAPLHVADATYNNINAQAYVGCDNDNIYAYHADHNEAGTCLGGSTYGGDWGTQSTSARLSGIFEHSVAARAYQAYSDKRIKDIIGVSNNTKDLSMLTQIQITDYTFIDKVNNTNQLQKKVIAQQLNDVYPQAVTLKKGEVPVIYATARETSYEDGYLTVSMENAHDLQPGENVIFLTNDSRLTAEVLTVPNEKTFIVEHSKAEEIVFVWGKGVNDFHSVDYDALTTLNISATQELAKRVLELENENAELKESKETTKASVRALEQEVKYLKEVVFQYCKN